MVDSKRFLGLCLVAAAVLMVACGGSSAEIEENCEQFCSWSFQCAAEADEAGTASPSFYGSDNLEGCVSQCFEANEPIYEYHSQCYDAHWDSNLCIAGISCEELGSDDDIIENRCGDAIDRQEQICSGSPM